MAEYLPLLSGYDPSLDTRPLVASRQSLGLLGPPHPLLSSLSFHFLCTMARQGHRAVMICRRSSVEKELPRPVYTLEEEEAGQAGAAFDNDVLDRVEMKYLESLDEVVWYMRNIHRFAEAQIPTCITIDTLDSFICADSDHLVAMGRVLSEIDDARRYIMKKLGQACHVMVSVAVTEGPLVRIMKYSMGRVLKMAVSKTGENEGMVMVKEVTGGQGATFKYAVRGDDSSYLVLLPS